MVLPLLAMLLVAPRRFELVEATLPIPGPGEVRIKVMIHPNAEEAANAG